jgi:coenzyme F420-0:L-glutamate ligase
MCSTVSIPIRLRKVGIGEKLSDLVLDSLKERNLAPKRGDLIAVASKVVSTCESRFVKLDDVKVREAAKRISRKWGLDQRLAALILREADEIFGGVRGFLLTTKCGVMTANAGIDLKNSPRGTAMLWPRYPDVSAARFRKFLERKFGVRLGVIIVDSRVTPLRLGTVGSAIGTSGFEPVVDYRGSPDIYGRRAMVTQANIADDLASTAHLLMGETNERVGLVVIRGAPIILRSKVDSKRARISFSQCLFTNSLLNSHFST